MDKNDGRVVSNFIVQALQGKDITIYGDGTQTRSFCYVDDLIVGMISLMNSPADVIGPINIGNPNEFSMSELLNEVLRLTISNSKIVNHPLPEDDPRQRQPEITQAREILGWEPKVQLSEGLTKTIEYFMKLGVS
jgi:UDP-glucuronate decarboxylase